MTLIVKRAMGECWKKVFQNCRSTGQTELQQDFRSHVVVKWLGNSAKIAQDFYLQVTDDHFEKALSGPEVNPEAVDAKPEAARERANERR